MVKKYWIFAIAAYIVFVGLSLYGLMIHRRPRLTSPPEQQPRVEMGQMITYHVTFRCGHYFTHTPQDGVAGVLRYLGVTEDAITWDEGLVVTSATGSLQYGHVDLLCRECQSKFFAGIKDGYVAIYYGSPRPGAELKILTDVRADLLPPDFQVDLRNGIPIKDEASLRIFLEAIDR